MPFTEYNGLRMPFCETLVKREIYIFEQSLLLPFEILAASFPFTFKEHVVLPGA